MTPATVNPGTMQRLNLPYCKNFYAHKSIALTRRAHREHPPPA